MEGTPTPGCNSVLEFLQDASKGRQDNPTLILQHKDMLMYVYTMHVMFVWVFLCVRIHVRVCMCACMCVQTHMHI